MGYEPNLLLRPAILLGLCALGHAYMVYMKRDVGCSGLGYETVAIMNKLCFDCANAFRSNDFVALCTSDRGDNSLVNKENQMCGCIQKWTKINPQLTLKQWEGVNIVSLRTSQAKTVIKGSLHSNCYDNPQFEKCWKLVGGAGRRKRSVPALHPLLAR